ncbi:hypothetical protein DFQ30_009459 [Apophysomyces sp. BC1015]|nr:hypothetical protein DFQ30_009459 [Apophysomyces sp. BC1015]
MTQLEEMVQQREFRKQEIIQNLERLWERLRVDTQERSQFLQTNAGITMHDMEQYENELKRLMRLREERIGDFIMAAREELTGLWDKLYFSEDERRQFDIAFNDEYTENSLESHENEISRLQLQLEDHKYLFERVERHMKLLEEVKQFEASTNDPSRLFGKGQRDPGRLLREEKFRKRISKEMPKIVQELEGALNEYETSTGKPFCVHGVPYIQTLKQKTSRHSSGSEEAPPSTPKTPNRDIRVPRRPMTSPHTKSPLLRLGFRTPQPSRTRPLEDLEARRQRFRRPMSAQQLSSDDSILHKVREGNIKKRQAQMARRVRDSGSSRSSETLQDENKAPMSSPLKVRKRAKRYRSAVGSPPLLSSDDDTALDLGIFDDGPELSDMSDHEI